MYPARPWTGRDGLNARCSARARAHNPPPTNHPPNAVKSIDQTPEAVLGSPKLPRLARASAPQPCLAPHGKERPQDATEKRCHGLQSQRARRSHGQALSRQRMYRVWQEATGSDRRLDPGIEPYRAETKIPFPLCRAETRMRGQFPLECKGTVRQKFPSHLLRPWPWQNRPQSEKAVTSGRAGGRVFANYLSEDGQGAARYGRRQEIPAPRRKARRPVSAHCGSCSKNTRTGAFMPFFIGPTAS